MVKARILRAGREFGKDVARGLLIYCTLSLFVFYAGLRGSSMNPTLKSGDQVIGNGILTMGKIERGNVVAFLNPEFSFPHIFLVKRVVALPGEKLDLCLEDIYRINGAVQAQYQSIHHNTPCPDDFSRSVTMSSGEYFLMGDNRDALTDSRNFGPVARWRIIAKVRFFLRPKERTFQRLN